ncbi:putative histidine kinase-like ATPase domain-containing protein [Rosa chinensis]|uniref:Putative histidine kinase-like ATPase domain-containing protein n=1 Tax=Rosa chinensis TaxID=74649 RepID=A0A2P6RIB4_ROSCH|nr:uncharacterized protein LOC112188598 [Rosa chinensis]PRQ46163.1 putative histidine kinase-like ATPase domain-containing protein [Rosa chinensis]
MSEKEAIDCEEGSSSSDRTKKEEALLCSAKLHIEEIRTQKFSIGKNQSFPLTQDLHFAVTNLSKQLYQKDSNFLMELILNADENEYRADVEPTLEFVMTQKDITGTGAPATLLVFNNEVGFSRENMDSICGMGHSTKKDKRQQSLIGERGSGFKSVFLVSSQPHIISNGYCVRFLEEPDQDCGIGYIVPHWVSGEPSLSSILDVYGLCNVLPTTTIVLPLKPEKVEAVRVQLSQLRPEILLFLSKLKQVHVRRCDPEATDDFSRFCKTSGTEQMELYKATSRVVQLSVKQRKGDSEELCKYYLWEEAFPVKPANRVGIRMNVQKWVITLAFPSRERMGKATSSVGIFACLPTEMVTNFPFLIQADFILNASRDCILLDNVWNLGILECIPSLFVDAFQSHSLHSSVDEPFEYLPAQASPIPEFNKVKESIRTRLQSLVIVPCQILEGTLSFVLPQDAVRVLPKFRDLVIGIRAKGNVLSGSSSSLLRKVLHPTLDLEKYNAVLKFLDVKCADDHWYTKCVQGLCNPTEDEMVIADSIISLLECIKFLMSSSLDDPLVRDFIKSIGKSRFLKTLNDYKTPEECVLFDPAWESILNQTDTPTIDVNFYGTEIFQYKNQLRDIGVKVDPLSVCSLLSGILTKLANQPHSCYTPDTTFITRIYSFLNKFHWRPEAPDESQFQVWIPDPPPGGWIMPQQCVLHVNHVRKYLFSSFFWLDELYAEELLPLFSSAFGVAENPSIHHYLKLWETWASSENLQVTLVECCSFWEYVIDNWNPKVEETLRQKLTKLPATKSTAEEIYLINRTEVFLADDLQLKKTFLSYDEAPLFVWFPTSNCLSSVPPRRLYAIYESLGVRKVSKSFVCKPHTILLLEELDKIDAQDGLIGRGLIKLILGFLAGPEVNMPLKERHNAACSLIKLSVYKLERPNQVIYRLMPSASTTVDVKKVKLVTWKKISHRLLIDNSGYRNGKSDPEFVTAFADELAQGLLVQARHYAAALSKLIQWGFMFDFNEKEVDFWLMRENLELPMEDKEFLSAAFLSSTELVRGKRASMETEESGPSTAMPSCKKLRQ